MSGRYASWTVARTAINKLVSIELMLQHFGLYCNSSGKVSCPFHVDNTPSLKVYAGKQNRWYCFSCKRGGGPLEFYAFKRKLTFTDAAEKLAKQFNITALKVLMPKSLTNRRREISASVYVQELDGWEKKFLCRLKRDYSIGIIMDCWSYIMDVLDRPRLFLMNNDRVEVKKLSVFEKDIVRFIESRVVTRYQVGKYDNTKNDSKVLPSSIKTERAGVSSKKNPEGRR